MGKIDLGGKVGLGMPTPHDLIHAIKNKDVSGAFWVVSGLKLGHLGLQMCVLNPLRWVRYDCKKGGHRYDFRPTPQDFNLEPCKGK